MSTIAQQAVDLALFTKFRDDAYKLMLEASKLHHLPEHYRAQAFAAAYLCGDRLHRVIGEPTQGDAEAIRSDLETMARRALDPLIESIGREAAVNFHDVNRRAFKDVVSDALENIAAELSEAGRELAASRDETIAENRREFLRA